MTDAQISMRLAMAIGWDVLPVEDVDDGVIVLDHAKQIDRYFDYRDPDVIWPIAERFDCFPVQANHHKRHGGRGWIVPTGTISDVHETAAKAVALAVIKAKELK